MKKCSKVAYTNIISFITMITNSHAQILYYVNDDNDDDDAPREIRVWRPWICKKYF